MRGHANGLARIMGPEEEMPVVGFGRGARVAAPLQNPRLLARIERGGDNGGTDIAGAMGAASGLYSPLSEKKLLLITDGNETDGDAGAEAASLREQGIQVFTNLPPPAMTRRIALAAFEAPEAVRAHS